MFVIYTDGSTGTGTKVKVASSGFTVWLGDTLFYAQSKRVLSNTPLLTGNIAELNALRLAFKWAHEHLLICDLFTDSELAYQVFNGTPVLRDPATKLLSRRITSFRELYAGRVHHIHRSVNNAHRLTDYLTRLALVGGDMEYRTPQECSNLEHSFSNDLLNLRKD